MFRKMRHDIVFLDIGLPDGDGHDLLQWMIDIDPDTFAVMFTGNDGTDMLMRSVEKGAKGFVSKPYDERKMKFFIQKAIHEKFLT